MCRVVLALTFLFSGWVKANDPLGTATKLGDYAYKVGLDFEDGSLILLAAAIALAFVEFTLGVAYVLGRHRRLTAIFGTAFLLLMTLLIVFIPMSDCGCFGDVLVLSPHQTLAKNVVLLACAIGVLRGYKLQKPLLGESVSWLVSLPCMVGIVAYAVWCVVCLPRVDFRPYYEGVNLRQVRNDLLSKPYEDKKTPYTFLAHRQDVVNLLFCNMKQTEDWTDAILNHKGVTLLLTAPYLETADQGCAGDINVLYEYAQEQGYGMFCLTSSEKEARHKWMEYTGAEYPFLYSGARPLKTMVRANPGLILLRDGVILRKWSNWNLPSTEELHSLLYNQ